MTRTLNHQMSLLALIYGDELIDDFEFCIKHSNVIDRLSHGIMTISGGEMGLLESVMEDYRSNSTAKNKKEAKILAEFYARLLRNRITHCRHREKINGKDLDRLFSKIKPLIKGCR